MPERELSGWRTYYSLYPFDDLHRHHRPAAIIAASMGGKFDQVLSALAPEPTDPELSDADRDMLRALGFDR